MTHQALGNAVEAAMNAALTLGWRRGFRSGVLVGALSALAVFALAAVLS